MNTQHNIDELFHYATKIKETNTSHDNYNILHALGFNNQEVMHSKFIAHLLNSNGNHKKGNLFLKSFFNTLAQNFKNKINVENILTENFKVVTEKQAGKRRIDIALESKDKAIIIENKIWAKDSDNQLKDYHSFFKEKYNEVDIIYLTPDGHSPSDNSCGDIKDSVICLSYSQITDWLIDTLNHLDIEKDNRLYLSLKMYIESVNKTINRDKYMEELFNLIKKDENINIGIDIYKTLSGKNLLKELEHNIRDFLENTIEELGYDPNRCNENGMDYIEILNQDILNGYIDINTNEQSLDYGYYNKGEKPNGIGSINANLNDEVFISIISKDKPKAMKFISEILDKIKILHDNS